LKRGGGGFMATRQLVVFTVNKEEFGIDIGQVNIIERPLEIFKVPNTPDFIEGLVNLRGKVHTLFNLRKRFNMPSAGFDDNTRIIMANAVQSVVGLIVDEVREIIKIEDADIESTPKTLAELKNRYIKGLARVNDRIILLLDVDTVISAS